MASKPSRSPEGGHTTVFHGTAVWNLPRLLRGNDSFMGLYVTDTPQRAQRYADAQTSREVSADIRALPDSVIVELHTPEEITWSRRPEDHPTLDKAEAAIKSWDIANVYVVGPVKENSRINVGGKYVPTLQWLQDTFGDKLHIVSSEDVQSGKYGSSG